KKWGMAISDIRPAGPPEAGGHIALLSSGALRRKRALLLPRVGSPGLVLSLRHPALKRASR
ncbi:MAG: hypothetical protein OXF43_02030, partial [Gammaproteobacteria bacterium]|nr:hypothetical protein [Gammaproteobacteria bacterium]